MLSSDSELNLFKSYALNQRMCYACNNAGVWILLASVSHRCSATLVYWSTPVFACLLYALVAVKGPAALAGACCLSARITGNAPGQLQLFFSSSIHFIQVDDLLFGDKLYLVRLPVTAAGLVDLAFGLLASGTAVSMGKGGPSDTTVVGIIVLARFESWCHGWISPASLAPG